VPKSVARTRPAVQRENNSAIQRRTRPLWPDIARELGLGKNGVYRAAERGEIPGAHRIGARWFVFSEEYERGLRGE
jgi:predicted DNA-binding transcriptional regulator AlpA